MLAYAAAILIAAANPIETLDGEQEAPFVELEAQELQDLVLEEEVTLDDIVMDDSLLSEDDSELIELEE